MDAPSLFNMFGDVPIVNAWLVPERSLNLQGYAFVEFVRASDAAALVAHCTDSPFIAKDGSRFPLTLATDEAMDSVSAFVVFVSDIDLPLPLCDGDLFQLFKQKYRSVVHAKVIVDMDTGMSKGYGYIHLRDPMDVRRILMELPTARFCDTPVHVRPYSKSRDNMRGYYGISKVARPLKPKRTFPQRAPAPFPPPPWSAPLAPLPPPPPGYEAWVFPPGSEGFPCNPRSRSAPLENFDFWLEQPCFAEALSQAVKRKLSNDADSCAKTDANIPATTGSLPPAHPWASERKRFRRAQPQAAEPEDESLNETLTLMLLGTNI